MAFLGISLWNNSFETANLKDKYYSIIHVENELLNPEEWKRRFKKVMVEKVNEIDIGDGIIEKTLNSSFLNEIHISDDFIKNTITVKNIENSLQKYIDTKRKDARRAERILLKALEKQKTPTSEIIQKVGLKVVKEFLSDKDNPISLDLKVKIKDYVIANKDKIEKSLKDFVFEEMDNFLIFNEAKASVVAETIDPNFDSKLSVFKKNENKLLWSIFGLLFGLFAVLFFIKKNNLLNYVPYFQIDLLLVSLGLLILGVSLPMVSIVANIEKINFQLMGAEINFENQNLVYRSKSIIQVFKILITQGMEVAGNELGRGIRLIGVAVFIVLFSVVFPLLKMFGLAILNYSKGGASQNPKWNFIATKLGKWSMADVFVVAVLISFLGINGLVDDEMGVLGENSISNTASTLDAGFYLFLAYVITSIAMSKYFKNKLTA